LPHNFKYTAPIPNLIEICWVVSGMEREDGQT